MFGERKRDKSYSGEREMKNKKRKKRKTFCEWKCVRVKAMEDKRRNKFKLKVKQNEKKKIR